VNQYPPPFVIQLFELVKSNRLANNQKFLLEGISKKEGLSYVFELGLLCANNEKINDALLIFESLKTEIENDERIFYNLGLLYSLQNDPDTAISCYDSAIQIKPSDVASIINKSQLLIQLKKYDEANKSLDEAISIDPDFPEAWSNKGIALNHLGRYADALKAFDEAIKINPLYSEAYANKSNSLIKLKRHFEAISACEQSTQIQPNFDALLNKGIALNELKKYQSAILSFDDALKIDSRSAVAFFGKGIAFTGLDKDEHAIREFDNALLIDPNYFEALLAKAFTLNKIKKFANAVSGFDAALLIDDASSKAYYGKGAAYVGLAQNDKAQLFFDHALRHKPNFRLAQWAKVFAIIPSILGSKDDINSIREVFIAEFRKLKNSLLNDVNLKSNEILEIVASTQPFYLAYHNFNNKNILSEYGDLCSKLMGKAVSIQPSPEENAPRLKIRLGIVSSHFRNHSVWHALTKGMIKNLCRETFEIHLFSTNPYCDKETDFAKENSDSFITYSHDLNAFAQEIVDKRIDFLFYPEIGMDQLTTQLASLRLSPIQLVGWGHPESSGLPTIDYYVSSELFELPNADDHYSEKLIKLPNLGTHYVDIVDIQSAKTPSLTKFPSDIPILICPGTSYKYQPDSDWIFAEITKRLSACKFMFFNLEDPLASVLSNRLKNEFSKHGLDSNEFISFLPWLNAREFHGLLKSSTVMLDTLHFSGFNTVIQAIGCNLPVVSHDGTYLRGRLGSGILKRIGLSELLVKDSAEYIQLAVRLCQDHSFRKNVKDKIIERKSILYEDVEPIKALEAFMINHSLNAKLFIKE
jgi:protein O-GlcNAc transferase